MLLELKEEYLMKLEEIKKHHNDKANIYTLEGSNDEAVFEKIKENVVDIFYTLFNVSFKKINNSESEVEKLKKLSDDYNGFLKKIPSPWIKKMAKDKEHDLMEEYYKEQLKLEKVDEIKELFTKVYERYTMEV